MPFILLNSALLVGLVAVAIPPIIHLLNRKRFNVVQWGAMQFLQVSERTRRRVFLEELLLMFVRMAAIAAMVFALAAPADRSGWFRVLSDRGQRDIVLVIDGSYSMAYAGPTGTAHDAARRWALEFLDELGPGDGVAVLQAKQQIEALVPNLTLDLDLVRSSLHMLPPPRGGCDWPGALQAAFRILTDSGKVQRDVVVLTDNQRQSWADDATLLRWELLAGQYGAANRPRVWVVNVDPQRPANPANWSLAPLRPSRAIASVGQQVRFKTAVVRHGEGEMRVPQQVRQEIDDRRVNDLPVPGATPEIGQVPLTLRLRFNSPGSHLVAAQIEGDSLPGDNRQEFAVEVLPSLPVLLVDGDPDVDARNRGVYFLRDALAPARDPSPAVIARVVSISDFDPDLLTRDIAGANTVPRVVVLANVSRLTTALDNAAGNFVASGGGLLVTLGDRVDARYYTDQLYRGGLGWLPAAVGEVTGNVNESNRAAQPLAATFLHTALEIFRDSTPGGLADARFPRYWTVIPDAGGQTVTMARLTGDVPFLVEKSFQAGRVIVASVPFDNSWRTNLIELPAFAPLAHELVYYLAAAGATTMNLVPGQPIRYRLPPNAPTEDWTIQVPDAEPKPIAVKDGQLVWENTREPGVYRLAHAASGVVRYFVVQTDARESDLSPCSEADRERVQKLLPSLTYADDQRAVIDGLFYSPQPIELWWLVMVAVIALLAVEVWLTRRRALAALS